MIVFFFYLVQTQCEHLTHVCLFVLLDWCDGGGSSLGEQLQVGAGVLAADWPAAGCTAGSWLLPQDPPQELQRSQTGE